MDASFLCSMYSVLHTHILLVLLVLVVLLWEPGARWGHGALDLKSHGPPFQSIGPNTYYVCQRPQELLRSLQDSGVARSRTIGSPVGAGITRTRRRQLHAASPDSRWRLSLTILQKLKLQKKSKASATLGGSWRRPNQSMQCKSSCSTSLHCTFPHIQQFS